MLEAMLASGRLPQAPEKKSALKLNLAALKRKALPVKKVRLCIDFGTAMSKAWATGRDASEPLPLPLGKIAGSEGLPVPSSIFIADDGRIFLGKEAETQQRATMKPGRARFDNLKRLLSEAEVGTELRMRALREGIDPIGSGASAGDLLLLYLAWITDLAEIALAEATAATKGKVGGANFDPRSVSRRFAIPCFESSDGAAGQQRAQWAKRTMSDVLLRAQILADTLHGKWDKLFLPEILPLIREAHELDVSALAPLLMEDAAVREPIAAGASRFDSAIGKAREPVSYPVRRFLLVVDAGAGTTDIALFQAIIPIGEVRAKYGLLRKSVRMCRVAGNEIDGILRPIILDACGAHETKLSPDDLAYAKIDLDSRIRELKQTLFERSNITIDLRPNLKGKLALSTLLADPKMRNDGDDLLKLREDIFSELFSDYDVDDLRAAYEGRAIPVHVLLTGGSSVIPIIAALAKGNLHTNGLNISFSKIDTLPEWVNRLPRTAAQMISEIYPQSAVAIGGSAPELPQELSDMEIPVTPPRKGWRKLPRDRMSGPLP